MQLSKLRPYVRVYGPHWEYKETSQMDDIINSTLRAGWKPVQFIVEAEGPVDYDHDERIERLVDPVDIFSPMMARILEKRILLDVIFKGRNPRYHLAASIDQGAKYIQFFLINSYPKFEGTARELKKARLRPTIFNFRKITERIELNLDEYVLELDGKNSNRVFLAEAVDRKGREAY